MILRGIFGIFHISGKALILQLWNECQRERIWLVCGYFVNISPSKAGYVKVCGSGERFCDFITLKYNPSCKRKTKLNYVIIYIIDKVGTLIFHLIGGGRHTTHHHPH